MRITCYSTFVIAHHYQSGLCCHSNMSLLCLVHDGIGMPVFSVAVAIFSSGLGTLTYIVCTKARSPVYLGSSFAFIAPMILAYNTGGIGGVMAGTLLVGLIYVACSIAIRFAGNEWIRKLLPDEVVGPMIVIIGLEGFGGRVYYPALHYYTFTQSSGIPEINPNSRWNCDRLCGRYGSRHG